MFALIIFNWIRNYKMNCTQAFFAKGTNIVALLETGIDTKSIQFVDENTKKGIKFTLIIDKTRYRSDDLGKLEFKHGENFRNGHVKFDVDLKPQKMYRLIQTFY